MTLGDENEKVVIRGLDKYGFLECRSRKTPSKVSVSVGLDIVYFMSRKLCESAERL